MRIYEVLDRTPLLERQLTELWERSVRATHLFLSDREIAKIKEGVPQAIREVPYLLTAERAHGVPAAFLGVEGWTLAMLFVEPEERGKGLGRRLVQEGVARYGVREVTVNEQNPLARGFYEHLGFRVFRRTELDEQGRPYPLLYMRWGR